MSLPPELSRAEYDALEAINWSRLKLLEKSPAHFKHGYGDDSSGFALGTAAHAAVLEPKKFGADFVVYPGPVRRGKAWEKFETEATRAGKSVPNKTEHALAVKVRDAVAKNSRAARYLSGGRAEFSMVWTLGGAGAEFRCKGRGDYLGADAIVDLKTTKDASPRAFASACARYGYFGQAAWYSDGYRTLTGEEKPFVIIAVETSAPYVVQVYRITGDALARGREQYLTLLGKLDYCQKNNFWGGYSEQEEIDLDVPQWSTMEDAQ